MAFDANDLSPHEHYVVDRIRNGETADFTPMHGPDGAKPSVRAGFLRKLMLQIDPDWLVRTPGVRLKGVRIEGALDLTDCSGAGGAGLPALSLENCDIPDVIDLSHARLARFSLEGSRLTRLVAVETGIDGELNLCAVQPGGAAGQEHFIARLRGIRVDGDLLARGAKFARTNESNEDVVFLQGAEINGNVLFDEGFEAFGAVSVAGARIQGWLQCSGGHFFNRSDNAEAVALNASTAQIGGNVAIDDGFKAEGIVNFFDSRIEGGFQFEQCSIRNDGGAALQLNNATIGGQFAGAGKITGQIVISSVQVGRNVDLRGLEISHPVKARSGESAFGTVIDATGASVGGAVLLQGANVKGEVLLADARISGYLSFGGGRFLNANGWAIRAPNVRVGGNLTLKVEEGGYAPHGVKTVIEGGAKFDRAQVDGALTWFNLELRGPGPTGHKGGMLSIADARIGGALQAKNLITQQDAYIDVSGASCAALEDDLKNGWGVERAPIDLDGFAYQRLEQDDRWRARLNWLKRGQRDGKRFSPQPYTVLAQVYARAGRREDARRILLAQHDQRTVLASAGPLTWALSSAFGLTAGYGFAPIRAARALILFLALGILGVFAMNAQGALVRPDGQACNGAIEPALYAIDVALPVIDLGQESRCAPGRTARADLPAGLAVADSEWRVFEGAALWKWAHALYAVLGAILTALAVITFSGMMKPRDD